jgi:hypothetical protein
VLVTALILLASATIAQRRSMFEMERLSASLVLKDPGPPPTPETRAAYEKLAKLPRQFGKTEGA